MTPDPLRTLRDRIKAAPDDIDPARQSSHFDKARDDLRQSLTQLEAAGISSQTIVAAMMTELLPRMIHAKGAAWASRTLAGLARGLDVSGSAGASGSDTELRSPCN